MTRLLPLLFLLPVSSLVAQSLPGIGPRERAEKAAPDSPEAAQLVQLPSRELDQRSDEFVALLRGRLAMQSREIDPFARHQDPDYRPPTPEPDRATPERGSAPATPITPFSDIIAGIRVTTVNASRRMFMVGDRSFRVGDRIPLDIGRAQPLPVQVVAVSNRSITFRNGESNETADLPLGIMPDGLEPSRRIEVPGIVPKGTTAPLSVNPVNGISANR